MIIINDLHCLIISDIFHNKEKKDKDSFKAKFTINTSSWEKIKNKNIEDFNIFF